MRGTAIVLAIVLATVHAAPLAAFLVPPPAEHWVVPPGSAADLMPPDPHVRTWPPYARQATPHPLPSPTGTTGLAKVLVLLIDFTDTASDPIHTGVYFDNALNAEGPSARTLRAYYKEVSFGGLTVNATIIPTWWHSSHTMAYYGNDSTTGVDDGNGPIYRLVVEAVKAADPTRDFRPFDADGDGVLDHLIVIHAGAGQENTAGNANLIWSHHWAVLDGDPTTPGPQSLTADGVQVYGYIMISEDSPVGVVAHEFGHGLGLPDLYDTDGSSAGAGLWDIMSGGSWNGNPAGSSPAHMSAWSIVRLGWVTPTDVTTALVGTTVVAVETSGKVFRLDVPGTSPPEYFLIENRQPVGFDAALPGSGLLIWHVDESQTTNDVDNHRLLDLEEADEGVSGDHPTDAGDPWHDSAAGWGPDTSPDSRAYSGQETGWRVRDISASGSNMTATIARDVTKDLGISAISLPFIAAVSDNVSVAIDVRNDGASPGDVTLEANVYRDRLEARSLVTQQTFGQPALGAQTTVRFHLSFVPGSAGRYIIHASLVAANDDIPSNDERVAHVLVTTFRLRDDIESGAGSWTTNGLGNDQHRWRIVNDTDPDGGSHSPAHAWRFGYVSTLIPNPFPPAWHMLTSPGVNVPSGPAYLIYYHRYDLTGRAIAALPIGANDTDDAYVEVRYNGGPWIRMAHYAGRDLTWRGVAFDLSANITGATTVQVRFNVSADVMARAGGWWIDDVMIASSGLGRAVLLLGSAGPYAGPAGGSVQFGLKIANVGEFATSFRLDAVLPAGWDASLLGDATVPLRGHVLVLAPDNDFALRIALAIPSNASSGTTYSTNITASALDDASVVGSVVVQVQVAGSFLSSDTLLILAVVLVAMVAVVVLVAGLRRRPRR